MLAAVLDNIKEINVREFQNPTIPSNGAILKVHSCGICSPDLKFINQFETLLNCFISFS